MSSLIYLDHKNDLKELRKKQLNDRYDTSISFYGFFKLGSWSSRLVMYMHLYVDINILIYEMWMWQLHLRYISNVYESHVEDWMENRSQGTWTPIYLCHLEEEEGGEWLEACGLQHAYVSHVKGWGGRETREIVRHTRLPKTLKDMETIWFRSCLWLPILIYKVLVLQNRLKVFWLFGE